MIHTQPHSVCLVRATLSPTHVENSVYLHTFKFWPLRTHVFLTHCVVFFFILYVGNWTQFQNKILQSVNNIVLVV